MKSQSFQGGWYCAARPGGIFAAQIRNGGVETYRGQVPRSPGGDLLQLDLASDGRFAGHGGNSFNAFEWDGTWQDRGVAFGNNACIYDASGALVVVRESGPPTWALGYDYCADDGTLVPTWRSYDPTTPMAHEHGVTDLWWWTIRGDIIIGQGGQGGLVAQFGGKRYQVAVGQTTFPKFHRTGDDLALAWVQEDTNEAHMLWMTVAELTTFPLVNTAPVPTPAPVPVPVPQPTPEPVPMPFLPPNIKNIRDRYVAKFPVPQGQGPEDFDPATGGASGFFEDKARAWTKGLAEQIVFETNDGTWGVKNAGGGRPQSKDSIAQNGGRLINFDLLSGVGTGHPSLVPEPQGEDITGQTFMPVSGVNHLDVPTPTPVPDPTPTPVPTPTPTPTPVPTGMDAELRAFLTELVAANKEQAKEIKGLRSDVKKAGAALALLLTKKK